MNRINLTRADIRLIQHFKADRILICQRNKIDSRIFAMMHSTITPIFRDTYVTTRLLRTIVNKSEKHEISKCTKCIITGVIYCVLAHRLSCHRGRDKTACRYKTEPLFHYCETTERKKITKKIESRDSSKAKQKEMRNFAQRNFFHVCLEIHRDKKRK